MYTYIYKSQTFARGIQSKVVFVCGGGGTGTKNREKRSGAAVFSPVVHQANENGF